MRRNAKNFFYIAILIFAVQLNSQVTLGQSVSSQDDSEARPPVSKADIEIIKRAQAILDSPSKWNRADTRICPADAKTFSLYCALEKATDEVSGNFEHRGAAMQEARFVIDEIAPNANYDHRLMGYNNDPKTTFADIQKVFQLLQSHIEKRLAEQQSGGPSPANSPAPKPRVEPAVTTADIQIIKRVKEMLDSPSKWSRTGTQDCPANPPTISLYCALMAADKEVKGPSDDQEVAIDEVRAVISETAPNGKKYSARLVQYNNDPATTFADLQKLLQLVEDRLTKRLAEQQGKGG
jgi:hypothetical protein